MVMRAINHSYDHVFSSRELFFPEIEISVFTSKCPAHYQFCLLIRDAKSVPLQVFTRMKNSEIIRKKSLRSDWLLNLIIQVVLGQSGMGKNFGVPDLTKFENCLLCNCLPHIRNEQARAVWLVSDSLPVSTYGYFINLWEQLRSLPESHQNSPLPEFYSSVHFLW